MKERRNAKEVEEKALRVNEEFKQKESHSIQNLKIEEDISVPTGNPMQMKKKRGRPSLSSKFKFSNSDDEKVEK